MEIRAILNSTIKALVDDTFFSVTFITKKGEVRHMQCRTGVSKYLNPDSRGQTQKQKDAVNENNLLTVADANIIRKAKEEKGIDIHVDPPELLKTIRPYRYVPCDRLLEFKAKGLHIKRNSVEDTEWTLVDNNI